MKFTKFIRIAALGAVVGGADCAWAQRAGDNALASAQDAFGTTVGNESIGLYTSREVRGFDPVQAGNIRLEGLYFDRQSPNPNEILVSSLIAGSSVRVGLSAQSYLFPAPTGIAELRLRIPEHERVYSAAVGYGPYSKMSLEANAQVPIIADKLSINVASSYTKEDNADATTPDLFTGAFIGRWAPTDNIEVIPFWSYKYTDGQNPRANIYTAGPFLPPKIKRHVSFTQPWAANHGYDQNFGAIVNASLSDTWRLRAGLFRSQVVRKEWYNNLFQNTQPDGTSDSTVVAYPHNRFGSYSGEVRLSKVFTTGSFRHTFTGAVRGRAVKRIFGGTDSELLGQVTIGELTEYAKPAFVFRPTNLDKVRQGTGGLAYEALWAGVGEFSVGMQKTSYRRALTVPAVGETVTRDTPFLPNATLALHATKQLTVFGSFTRGLEESGEATNNATNRGEALPAIRTSQIDVGLRYTITPDVTAVASLFEVKKPYLGLNPANLYTNVGNVKHQGVEVSVAGEVADGLTIVAGSVFLKARVSGDLVDRGLIGRIPLGRIPRSTHFDVEYGPASWSGVSVDLVVDNRSSRVATADNLARIEGRTMVNVGGRYRFKVMDADATLRLQVRNVGNTFRWDINANQLALVTEEKRRFSLSLAADF